MPVSQANNFSCYRTVFYFYFSGALFQVPSFIQLICHSYSSFTIQQANFCLAWPVAYSFKTNNYKIKIVVMKKIIILTAILASAFLICGFAAASFNKKETKRINISVSKMAGYESAAYKDAFATLYVSVYRVKGNTKQLIWEHNYSQTQLKNFPSANKPLQQSVTINDITECNVKIEVCYSLIYNTKGSIMNFCNTELVTRHVTSKNVNIHI